MILCIFPSSQYTRSATTHPCLLMLTISSLDLGITNSDTPPHLFISRVQWWPFLPAKKHTVKNTSRFSGNFSRRLQTSHAWTARPQHTPGGLRGIWAVSSVSAAPESTVPWGRTSRVSSRSIWTRGPTSRSNQW